MKRLWLALGLCLVSLGVPVGHGLPAASGLVLASRAQGAPVITGLEISLWPEYDRPGVLVIFRGQFDPAGTYPLPVEMVIPADAGPPNAVAYVGQDGGRFNQQYTTRVEGDDMIVSFELPAPGFQLEYYDDLPIPDADVREYTFTFTAEYPVRDLSLEVQEPPLAQEFQLDPAADSSSVASDGLRYNTLQAGSVDQGDSLSWSFRYVKEDDRLTTAFFEQAAPSPAPEQPAAPAQGNSTVALFVVAFVALVGVGVAAYWLGQRTQSPAPRKASAAGKAPSQAARRKRERTGDRVLEPYFCHKCGTEIRDDAHFCSGCGAAVRRE